MRPAVSIRSLLHPGKAPWLSCCGGACYLAALQASTLQPDESTPGTLPLDLFLLAVSAQAHHALTRSMGR